MQSVGTDNWWCWCFNKFVSAWWRGVSRKSITVRATIHGNASNNKTPIEVVTKFWTRIILVSFCIHWRSEGEHSSILLSGSNGNHRGSNYRLRQTSLEASASRLSDLWPIETVDRIRVLIRRRTQPKEWRVSSASKKANRVIFSSQVHLERFNCSRFSRMIRILNVFSDSELWSCLKL